MTKEQQRGRSRRKRQRRKHDRRLHRAAVKAQIETLTFDESEVVAILDTNAVLDIISCHDVVDSTKESPKDRDYRGRRAGAGIRLALHFHETGALTLSATHEALEVARRHAPPREPGMKTNFITIWLYFTKDILLPKWRIGNLPAAICPDLRGNHMDDALIALAAAYKCPLISSEGVSRRGPNPRNRLRKQAAKYGVQVVAPEEFYRGKIKAPSIERFMTEFDRLGPSFHKGESDYKDAQATLHQIYEYYVKLLNGTKSDAEFS